MQGLKIFLILIEISLSVIWVKNHSDLAGFSNSLGIVMDLKKQAAAHKKKGIFQNST